MTTRTDGRSCTNALYLPLQERGTASSLLRRSEIQVFFVLVVVFLGCRLWRLDYSLWNDEVFGVLATRLSWSELVGHIIERDVHPVLFYLLLKGWTLIGGESLLWLRLFPVLTAMVALVPFYFLCRELKLKTREINLALTLMAVNQYLVIWSQNLRMYSLLLFFTLCSLWLFLKFTTSSSEQTQLLIGLFAINLCLVYTHYYGWLIVGTESAYALFFPRRKLRLFAVSVACVVLFFTPWAYAVAKVAIKNRDLVELARFNRPGWKGFVEHFGTLNGLFRHNMRISPLPTLVGILLFALPLVAWGWHIVARSPREQALKSDSDLFRFLSLFAFVPPCIAWTVSEIGPRSFWGQRYLIISAVPYLILIAVSANRLSPTWVKNVAIATMVMWASLAGVKGINEERVSFESLVRQMIQAEPFRGDDITVFALSGTTEHPIKYYVDLTGDERFRIEQRPIASLEGKHFWVAAQESPWQEEPIRETVVRQLIDKQYQVGEGFESGPRGFRAILFPVYSRQKQGD